MKLGEILIEMRVIDEYQLQRALDSQLIYGGHLGTCLIELGHITEDQLGQVLAKTCGVPCATKQLFENIPKSVIDSLPKSAVEKHRAVPLRLENKKLHIAMMTPSDLQTVDELSFACGREVVPWIAPEVRLLQAMDRYYDVARRMRYITLARQLDGDEGVMRLVDPAIAPQLETRFEARRPTPARHPPTAAARPKTVAKAAPEPAAEQPKTVARSAPAPAATQRRTVAKTAPAPAPAVAQAATATVARKKGTSAAQLLARSVSTYDPLEPLATLLCRVAGEEMLGKILIEQAAPGATRSILFTVQKGDAVPWNWRGIELEPSTARAIHFPISNEPLFGLLLGEGSYRGPVPEDRRYQGFFDALGIDRPNEMVLVPAYADDRLVAMLYFDDGNGKGIEEETSTFSRIARKTGLALNLIQIKQRIRTV